MRKIACVYIYIHTYVQVYKYACSTPRLRHAEMHILPIYPEQLLGNDCENPKSKDLKIQKPKNPKMQRSKNLKIQESKNPKIQKSKKLQDYVDVKSFGVLDF